MLRTFSFSPFSPFLSAFVTFLMDACLGTWAHVWALGRAFWRPGARLGTRAGILAPGRAFGHAGGHFGARARVWARGRAFWRPDVHSDFNLLCYQSNLESILTPRLKIRLSVQSLFEFSKLIVDWTWTNLLTAIVSQAFFLRSTIMYSCKNFYHCNQSK